MCLRSSQHAPINRCNHSKTPSKNQTTKMVKPYKGFQGQGHIKQDLTELAGKGRLPVPVQTEPPLSICSETKSFLFV